MGRIYAVTEKWTIFARGHGTTFGWVNGDETTLEVGVLDMRESALFELMCAKTGALCMDEEVRAPRGWAYSRSGRMGSWIARLTWFLH